MDPVNLLALEAAKGGPFRIRHAGQDWLLPDPRDLPYTTVMELLYSEHINGAPRMPQWKSRLLFQRWQAHYDLPPFQDAQRLSYLVEHYRPAMEYDLRAEVGEDLNELWHGRQWRKLLNLVDHLPTNTWYSQAVLNDEDHVRMIVEAEKRAEASGEKPSADPGPALKTWSPEVAAMTDVLDAVRSVRHAIVAVNSDKGKVPKHPDPAPRPKSALDRARKAMAYDRKKAKHEKLVARMLPHKAQKAQD